MLLALAIATLGFCLVAAERLLRGVRRLPRLPLVPPRAPSSGWPRVSVIVPARNEASTIRVALQSVLGQDYPDYDVVVLDDRSDDGTGALLDEMAATSPRLRVVHLHELPAGWLGKNYALHQGARSASGSILLFTDADVILDPSTLRRAVAALIAAQADHLTAIPGVILRSLALDAFLGSFSLFFSLFYRVWDVRDPRRSAYLGIGAFNMVRADVYRAIGTHAAIAMRPDDDMKLGKLIKRAGFRTEVVLGDPCVRVEWYPSLRALVDGLMKNTFAGLDYRVRNTVLAVVAQCALNVWPFIALVATRGAAQWLNAAAVLVILVVYADHARHHGFRPWLAIAHPCSSLLMSYILVRATVLTLARDGIAWRGTRYPLAALRANRV